MPSDLMTLHLTGATPQSPSVDLVPLDTNRTQELAKAYFNAYPPGIACNTLEEAVQEIRETFAGEYGSLHHRPVRRSRRPGRGTWQSPGPARNQPVH